MKEVDTSQMRSCEPGSWALTESHPAGPICAFCGKARHEVHTMLSRKRAYICGDCIVLSCFIQSMRMADPKTPGNLVGG